MNTILYVAEFHRAFGVPCVERPAFPTPASDGLRFTEEQDIRCAVGFMRDALRVFKGGAAMGSRCCLRLALETEELIELADAMRTRDLEAALDAQVDRRYILDGTTLELGMAGVFYDAFGRVHTANMAKLGADGKPIIDATGKVRKPEGWKAPDLSDLVK